MASAKLGLGPPLMQYALIIGAFVSAGEPFKAILGFMEAIREGAFELIRDGEPQLAQCHLVFRIDGKDIAADGFRFFRLVQVTIVLNFRKRLSDAILRDCL